MTSSYEALAEDGPLAGNPNLTVEKPDGQWEPEPVWTTGPGAHERHLYGYQGVSLGPSGVPFYKYVRTLEPNEPWPRA